MNENEEIDATIAYLEERLEIIGSGIKVIGEHLQDISDRLTILQMEIELATENL